MPKNRPRGLRRSTLTPRQFKGLSTMYNQPPRKDDAERIYYVTDSTGATKKATSNEKYVADALDKFGFEYTFQMGVGGGKAVSGGIVLDFLVETVPQPTPIWVHGEYWHTGPKKAADVRAMQMVEDFGKGAYRLGVEIWGHESNSPEAAEIAVRRKIF